MGLVTHPGRPFTPARGERLLSQMIEGNAILSWGGGGGVRRRRRRRGGDTTSCEEERTLETEDRRWLRNETTCSKQPITSETLD